jgi:methylglutaconyl-CoA hydratase
MGLVHQVCAPGMLDQAAGPMLEALLTCAPEAVGKTKELIEEAILRDGEASFADAMAREAAGRRHLPEAAEGIASFSEKRLPSWYPVKG